ncbi:MAG: hypothetical protein K2X52_15940 [Mycobacteriaceae bacterium]|nr:hypothetical protein [Mycobacteriaceae bacterium]
MKIVALAGAGAAIIIGSLMGPGLTSASASVEGFLLEMDTPSATPAEQLAQGNSFCNALTGGRAKQLSGPAAADIIGNFIWDPAFEGRAGVYVTRLMVTAVRELCPANSDFLMTAARAYDAQAGE